MYIMQKMLVLGGYEVGNMDAVMDEVTLNLLPNFKGFRSLSLRRADFSTQEALNAKFQKIIPAPDLQYYKAVEILSSKS